MGKEMVKVTINKDGTKKVVTKPQLLLSQQTTRAHIHYRILESFTLNPWVQLLFMNTGP